MRTGLLSLKDVHGAMLTIVVSYDDIVRVRSRNKRCNYLTVLRPSHGNYHNGEFTISRDYEWFCARVMKIILGRNNGLS